MTKARTLADFISDGSPLADGTVDVSEVSGAAPLANPTFTGTVTSTGDFVLGDNDKAIFGAGSDLQIYHSADIGNKITGQGTYGNISIQSHSVKVLDNGGNTLADFSEDGGAARLHRAGVGVKLATTSTGVDITGDVGADTATITGTVTAGQYDSTEALPTVRPSLLLDFANSKTLDPRITFTRGSTATYWDGKTTTKAEENLMTYSQDFSNSSWSKTQVISSFGTITAPDGTTTASSFIASTSNTYHLIYKYQTPTTADPYTFSVYLKSNGYDAQVRVAGRGAGWAFANFDLTNGTVGNTGGSNLSSTSITSVGNGWYRCSITSTLIVDSSVGGEFGISSDPTNDGENPQFAGDGTSGIYAWGFQIEQRSSATAYTATTSSPIVKYQPILQTAASGEARFDHDPVTGESKGLLIEEARTNLVTQSENASGWTDNEVVDYFNSVIAPDGTQTANWAVKQSGNTRPYLGTGNPTTMNGTYTGSCFFKKHDTDYVQLSWQGDGDAHANFDLANGTVTVEDNCTAGIEAVGNGWYRCHFTNTTTLGEGLHISPIAESNADRLPTFTSHCDMIYWGAQVETGSFPTSYIKTSGSTVTRVVDAAQMTDDNFSSWFNNSEGTFFAEATTSRDISSSTDSRTNVIHVSNANGSATMHLGQNSVGGTNNHRWYVNPNTSQVADISFSSSAQTLRMAAVYALNDVAAADSTYSTVNTDTAVDLPPEMIAMGIGSRFPAQAQANCGPIKKIAYYPQRLSNATLQAMTEE